MGKLHLTPVTELLKFRLVDKLPQQGGVGFLRVLSLAALVAQVLKEIFNQILHESCGPLINLAAAQSDFPVRREYASRYFAWVFATTSDGSAGAGGVLFQESVSR